MSRRVEQLTDGTFVVRPGSLFRRCTGSRKQAGQLDWQPSENNRRAKYYRLTRAGKKQLGEETAQWNRIALAIGRALEA